MPGVALRCVTCHIRQRSSFYPNYTTAIPNCLGCYLMAIIGNNLTLRKKYPDISTEFLVGFCGSFTTFSGWIYAIVNSRTNAGKLEELISGCCLPLVFYLFGTETLFLVTETLKYMTPDTSSTIPMDVHKTVVGGDEEESKQLQYSALQVEVSPETSYSGCTSSSNDCTNSGITTPETTTPTYTNEDHCRLAVFSIVLCACTVVLVVTIDIGLLGSPYYDGLPGSSMWYCMWAPAGALSRYLLSIKLNSKTSKFGTFSANVLAVVIFGILQLLDISTNGEYASLIEPVMSGFCGSLSTVSTFIADVVALRQTITLKSRKLIHLKKKSSDIHYTDCHSSLRCTYGTFIHPQAYSIGSIGISLFLAFMFTYLTTI